MYEKQKQKVWKESQTTTQSENIYSIKLIHRKRQITHNNDKSLMTTLNLNPSLRAKPPKGTRFKPDKFKFGALK